uniref:Transmembrane protein n=1 Tax=Elaeophora elaphi TaxID=1147741 RepID=A0A0R3S584_9BILA
MTIFSRGSASRKEDADDDGNTRSTSKPTTLLDGVTTPAAGFGIRSYLHQFYQSPAVEDIESAGAWYLLPPPPAQRTGLWLCRLLTVFGLVLLIGGAVAIVVGYTWPHEGVEESIARIAIYQDEDGSFYVPPEKLAEILKDPMRHWKMFGLCMFATGAVMLALSLLTPTLVGSFNSKRLAAFMSEDSTPNEPPIRLYPASGKNEIIRHPNSNDKHDKITPDSGPVPVLKEIAKVQPTEGKIGGDSNGNDDSRGKQTNADDLLLGGEDTQQ